jgi:PAT family beta-lactamase induction signal transducer AmpG
LTTEVQEQSQSEPSAPVLDYAAADRAAINPWWFVPVLYFMQFLPNGLVTSMFAAIYKSLGIDNVKIALWTGLAALPWSFKMFWGPLVDTNSTKRKWTIAMQALLFLTLLVTAGAMKSNAFFGLTVACLFIMATLSATHDIACDGLYLLSLDKKRQAAFSGVMATFSRLGRLFVDSGLVVIAGRLIVEGWDKKLAWLVALGIAALCYGGGMVWNFFMLPRPAADVPVADVAPEERQKNIWRTLTIIAAGVVIYYLINGTLQLTAYAIYHNVRAGSVPKNWELTRSEFIQQWIKLGVGAILLPLLWSLIRKQVRGTPMGDAFVSYFRQDGFGAILSFIVFYRFGEAMIFAMAALFILDKRELGGIGVNVEQLGMIKGLAQPLGLILGGLIGGWWVSRVGLRRAFWPLVVCMHVPNLLYIWAAYHAEWIANRTYVFDALFVTLPILIGVILFAIVKIRRSLIAMIVAAILISLAVRVSFYVWQAHVPITLQSGPLYPIVFLEAFGYGVGFAGYFVYLMHVAQRGVFVTSHYAIGTGLGALFIAFATILAGIVQTVFGYKGVFIAACLFTIPGTLTLLIIPMDSEQTKSIKAASDH